MTNYLYVYFPYIFIIYNWEMLRLQHFYNIFYNKSQVVSCYWFKFQTNAKIIFLPQLTTSNSLPLRICCKNVVDISFLPNLLCSWYQLITFYKKIPINYENIFNILSHFLMSFYFLLVIQCYLLPIYDYIFFKWF